MIAAEVGIVVSLSLEAMASPSSTNLVIAIDSPESVRVPNDTVPEEVRLVADSVEPLKDKSESSLRTPLVPAKTTLPLVSPSAVSVAARKSKPPMSTLFATVRDVIASTVPPSMSGELISGEVKVLLVSVSVVALPTSVSVASGKVIVRSALGLPGVSVSSFASADEPSKIKSVVIVELLCDRDWETKL